MKKIKVTKVTENFGIKIRVERVKKNLSQEALSELSDISRPTIGAIERAEKVPTIETAGKLAKGLGIELYKLFIFDD